MNHLTFRLPSSRHSPALSHTIHLQFKLPYWSILTYPNPQVRLQPSICHRPGFCCYSPESLHCRWVRLPNFVDISFPLLVSPPSPRAVTVSNTKIFLIWMLSFKNEWNMQGGTQSSARESFNGSMIQAQSCSDAGFSNTASRSAYAPVTGTYSPSPLGKNSPSFPFSLVCSPSRTSPSIID